MNAIFALYEKWKCGILDVLKSNPKSDQSNRASSDFTRKSCRYIQFYDHLSVVQYLRA